MLSDTSKPSYYRSQLFNELYYLVDGGTVWCDSHSHGIPNTSSESLPPPLRWYDRIMEVESVSPQPLSARSEEDDELLATQTRRLNDRATVHAALVRRAMAACASVDNWTTVRRLLLEYNGEQLVGCEGDQRNIGQFLYLEGHEYYMYNTCDVHFYAGHALLMLFPEIELSMQRDYLLASAKEDSTMRLMCGSGVWRPRKVRWSVPHDLGSPTGLPWIQVNIYNFQDVSNWKDLGPKLILQVYRDYVLYDCGSRHAGKGPRPLPLKFLQFAFPTLVQVMQYYEQYDTDRDGMIENEGFPDQTYDIWSCLGVSAYTGGLWITACEAMAAMARILRHESLETRYSAMATNARRVYNATLWNGTYFSYDNSTSPQHDSVMSDMLAGQWMAALCGLPSIVLASPTMSAEEKIRSCLATIYSRNVVEYGQGKFCGAVNGMSAKGGVDDTCIQSREVWTGTTYALSSLMLTEYVKSLRAMRDNQCPAREGMCPPPTSLLRQQHVQVSCLASAALYEGLWSLAADRHEPSSTLWRRVQQWLGVHSSSRLAARYYVQGTTGQERGEVSYEQRLLSPHGSSSVIATSEQTALSSVTQLYHWAFMTMRGESSLLSLSLWLSIGVRYL